jgi:membrane fusion protein (multidrug efflux system)
MVNKSSKLEFVLIAVLATLCIALKASPQQSISAPLQRVKLSSTIEETIDEMFVKEGDRVEKGQPLVAFSDEIYCLTVDRLELLIEKAKYDWITSKELASRNIHTNADLGNFKLEYDKLSVELKMAQHNLTERKIVSPISGIVSRKNYSAGEVAQRSQPIYEIINTSFLMMEFYLGVEYLDKVKLGGVYQVQFPAVSETGYFKAKVHFIDPEVDSQSGLFRVRLVMDNNKHQLKAGLRSVVQF